MEGIVSWGGYVPIYRLSGEVVSKVWGGRGKGERAVANSDEDSLTMGVEAAAACLEGIDRSTVDALYFASTTAPYREKQSASIIAAALDLREDILTVDIADSLRSATSALKLALQSVKSGAARNVLVIAADARLAPPNSDLEMTFGDGAAALLIGNDAAVTVEASYSATSEFVDIWRTDSDKLVKRWEDRFIADEGYIPIMKRAAAGVLKAANITANDLAKACYYAHDPRNHKGITKSMGVDPAKVQDPLFDKVGNTGSAFVLMMLCGALETAKAGDKIMLIGFGDGADAFVLKVDKVKANMSLSEYIASKTLFETYGKYIKFKGTMDFEQPMDSPPRTSVSQIWRDRKWVFRCHAHKCQKCGRVQFPMQTFCMNCNADSKFLDEVNISSRKGTLLTYSADERAPVVDPPNVLSAVNLEGDVRVFSQMTDRDLSKLKVGMTMELTFRKIHDALGVHNYFWKCKPARRSKEAK